VFGDWCSAEVGLREEAGVPSAASRPEYSVTRSADSPWMPLGGHLSELRLRIMVAAAALLGGSCVGLIGAPHVIDALARSVGGFVFTFPAEAFLAHLRIAFAIGGIVAGPVLVNQLLLFVAPALTTTERRWSLLILPSAFVLFMAGLVFAYFVLCPVALRFLLGLHGLDAMIALSVGRFTSFLASLLISLGLVFELPLVVIVLVRAGVITYAGLVRTRRYVYVASTVVAAALTPPDVVSQVLMAFPMIVLFEISLILSRWTRRARREEGGGRT
jgi:sec-independent protein translocase protein TatC